MGKAQAQEKEQTVDCQEILALHRLSELDFAAEERSKKRNKELSYFALEYATDTKIIRFKKIVAEANPFDARWNGYYEERDGEKMLNSTNGREKLLKVWRNQHRCCPVCGEPITSDTGFKVHKVFRHGKSPWLEW